MNRFTLTFILLLLAGITAKSQITVVLSTCGSLTMDSSYTDATGRTVFVDVNEGTYSIQWHAQSNAWVFVYLPGYVIGYSNSFASTPKPPCFGTGSWTTVNSQCGTLTSLTGQCQSSISGIDDLSLTKDITVYPNPATNQVNFSGVENGSKIEILDITGKVIFKTISNNQLTGIDLKGKAKGIYMYRITDKNNYVRQGKLSVI